MNLVEIERIATKIRKEFENREIDYHLMKKLYLEYNPLADIDQFLDKSRKLFPRLNCGLASVCLKKIIGKGDVVPGKYGKNNHTFLLLGEVVVDITSDQYRGPKVYVGPLRNPWSLLD